MATAPERLHLAVALDGTGWHPASWREPDARPADLLTPRYWTDLVSEAERGLLDFVTIEDGLTLQFDNPLRADERTDRVRGRLDAVLIASRVAPRTSHIGLIPTAITTHTEPFHLSKAIATLDYVSSGRAGVRVQVSGSRDAAAHFGRRTVPDEPKDFAGELFTEAADYVEVIRRLWDSWEDDAEIRDVATGRFIDRTKLHYIDFEGSQFSVKGPSITPRPPQAHPPVVLHLGDGSDEADAVAVIGRWADVVRVAAPDLAASAAARQRVRAAVAAAGRDPDAVPVLLDVETLLAATAGDAARTLEQLDDWAGATGPAAAPGTLRAVGTPDELAELIGDAVGGGAADGVTLAPLALPGGLRVITGELVPALVARGLRPAAPRPGSLRDRFGLPRPANYFTEARA